MHQTECWWYPSPINYSCISIFVLWSQQSILLAWPFASCDLLFLLVKELTVDISICSRCVFEARRDFRVLGNGWEISRSGRAFGVLWASRIGVASSVYQRIFSTLLVAHFLYDSLTFCLWVLRGFVRLTDTSPYIWHLVAVDISVGSTYASIVEDSIPIRPLNLSLQFYDSVTGDDRIKRISKWNKWIHRNRRVEDKDYTYNDKEKSIKVR